MPIKDKLLDLVSAHPKLVTLGLGLGLTLVIGIAIGMSAHSHLAFALRVKSVSGCYAC